MALQRLLRDHSRVTTRYLAWQLGVSVRSVARDLAYLRDHGREVEAARGSDGGIDGIAGFDVDEESIVTLLGLLISEQLGLPLFAAGMDRAFERLAAAFPTLRRRVIVAKPADRAESYAQPDPAVMRQLQVAFAHQLTIDAVCRNADGGLSSYRIEPHVLVIRWPSWYLLAYDCRAREARLIRLDTFGAVRPLRLRRFHAR